FFFQAEDGIRDKLVTGVQTCALPIYERRVVAGRRAEAVDVGGTWQVVAGNHRRVARAQLGGRDQAEWRLALPGSGEPCSVVEERSEERRVGKECGCRAAAGGA